MGDKGADDFEDLRGSGVEVVALLVLLAVLAIGILIGVGCGAVMFGG